MCRSLRTVARTRTLLMVARMYFIRLPLNDCHTSWATPLCSTSSARCHRKSRRACRLSIVEQRTDPFIGPPGSRVGDRFETGGEGHAEFVTPSIQHSE